MTFLIVIVLVVYASIKLAMLLDKHNPNLAQFTELDVFDKTEKINLNEIGFRFAFTVEGYHS